MIRKLFFLTILLAGFTLACGSNPVVSKTATHQVPRMEYDAYMKKMIGGKEWVVPAHLDIDNWIPMGRILTQRESELLHLRKENLSAGGYYHNEIRERHSFEVKWLEAGTEVWATQDGTPRYLVSCGNLIIEALKTVVPPENVTFPDGKFHYANSVEEIPNTTDSSPATLKVPPSTSGGMSLFQDLGNKLLNLLKWLVGIFLLTTFFVLMLILLMLFFNALYDTMSWLRNRMRGAPTTGLAPTPKTIVPPPPPPASPAPSQTPVNRPAATRMTRVGPFNSVHVSDRQTDGFHVSADGREIGVYKNPVRTEDAGSDGHYVVVEEPLV